MKPSLSRRAAGIVLIAFSTASLAEELPRPAPIGKPATEVYRYRMPDGRIVYSDKPVKGGKIDETITIDPPVDSSGASESPSRPVVPPRSERTPVNRVTTIPVPGKEKTPDDADADVTRAEMLLEDARKRQKAGVEPLAGERTGNTGGGSRLNDAYQARQRRLAEEVAEAEAVLRKVVAERDAPERTR